MVHRVFAEDLSGTHATIDGPEAHHLLNVLRLKPGDEVQLFDGQGTVADGTIQSGSRKSARVSLLSRQMAPYRPVRRVSVAAAPPKGERLRWMVEKLTEVGVAELVLLQTSRTIVHPGETRLDKLQATVISACKQSGRNHLMRLRPLTPLSAFLSQHRQPRSVEDPSAESALPRATRMVLAHPENPGIPLADPRPGSRAAPSHAADLLLIGPEGGFSPAEVTEILQAGAESVCWPNSILRIETAAVVFAAHLINSVRCGEPREMLDTAAPSA